MPHTPTKTGGARRGGPAVRAGGRAVSDRTFLDFVLDQLRGLPALKCWAMFGGHGLYQGPVFFAIVHRGRFYFRVGDATRAAYEARGMKPFRPGPSQTLKSYYEVPADVLEDAAEGARWARAAAAAGVERGSRVRP